MVAAALVLSAATGFAQGIATEKLNYQPGERVIITGEGWRAQEAVSIVISNTAGSGTPFRINAVAGINGSFRNASYVVQESDRDRMMLVTARGASGVETMVAFKGSGAPGSLKCTALAPNDSSHYGMVAGETVTCTIEDASDLSAAQQDGSAPVEVMIKSGVLGNKAATVVSVEGTTITFKYTAPEEASGTSIVSYGPIRACDASSGKCTAFPTLGNDANSMVISGSESSAGFAYQAEASARTMATAVAQGSCLPPGCPAQLQVSKLPQNGSFTQGSQLTFNIVVSNPAALGSASATNVKLQDVLPSLGGLVWQNAVTTQGSCVNPIVGNTLNCSLGTIPPQGSVTVKVTSTTTTPAAACVCQANPNAMATADGGLIAYGSGTLNCTASQLKVVKTPDNGTFQQGGQVTYNIYVSNPAPSGSPDVTNVVVTDQLPTNGGLTWVTATSYPVGTCSITGSTLNCNIPNIPAGRTVTITVSSPPTTPASACQSQPNPAAIATANGGLRAQDSGSQSCTPSSLPQLRVVKTPDNGTFVSGAQLTYTIVVSNPAPAGSASATNVTLSDVLPTNGGLTWISSTATQGSCSISGNTLNCSLGTIAAGASVTVTVSSPASTPAAACQSQPNPAAIATASGGLTAQDSGSMTCTPSNPPQLRVVKTPDAGTFTQGGQVTYTILVSNPAPSGYPDAMNVKVTDQLPTNGGLTWITATSSPVGTCSISGNVLNCSIPNIPAQRTVTIRVYSPSTTPADACQPQPNPAAIATADGGLTAQDSGYQSCTPSNPPQLRVVKTPDNGIFAQGAQVTFTIVVSNPGPAGSAAAMDVRLTDSLPTNGGLTWTSFTTSQGTCSITNNTLNCTLGNLAAGASAMITVSSPATTPADACQLQPNAAAVATALGGLSAQDSGSLTCIPQGPPQLRVVKTPDNGIFAANGQVTFTIVVSNPAPAGSAAATNVMLSDGLPTNGGLTWVSTTTTQGTCGLTGNVLNCSLGTLAAGASATITVSSPATTPAAACVTQPNPAAIATADGGLTAQDSGSVTCSSTPPPQLRVVKTPDNGTFTAGGQVTYTIRVSNPAPSGSADAMHVVLTDVLPTNGGLTWTGATITPVGSCSITGNTLNCTIPNIPAQRTVFITVSSPPTTPPEACQPQPNPAAIATADGGLTAQDSGSQSCAGLPQLKVVKTPDNGIFLQGGQLTYTIVVSNPAVAGSAAATNVALTDLLPTNGGLTWISSTTTQGTCSITSGNALSCSLGTIAAGASVTVTVSTPATTPAAACQSQPNPVAFATATGGLTAQDSGSLNCVPPVANLGDRVWLDLNGNGIQDCQDTNNNGIIGDLGDTGPECSAGVPGMTVSLVNCQSTSVVLATTQTDANGFYLFPNLAPGQYCVKFGPIPAGACTSGIPQFTTQNAGTNDAFDSDADTVTGLAPAVTLAAGETNRTVDAGVVCAACALSVNKTCQVQTPPSTSFVCSNAKPIDSITMIWTGQSGIYIKAWKGAVGTILLSTQGPIATGQKVTVTGMGGSPLDQFWEIFSGPPSPTNKLGQSDFHISCSDVDMNGPEDCGKLEGNAKTTSTALINLWQFEGMAGNGQALICSGGSQTQEACSITASSPSCASLGVKPKSLTFRYTGSDCSASRNSEAPDKWSCSGVPGPSPIISIIKDPAKITVTPTTALNVGDLVTVSAIGSDMGSEIQLQIGGQFLKIHTSCSQPLGVGDVFGSLQLVQFNGQGGGAQVMYSYEVKNNGTQPLDITSVSDNKLGELLTQTTTVAAGASLTLQKSAFISQTTTNDVTATAHFAGSSNVCGQAHDQLTVTVNGAP